MKNEGGGDEAEAVDHEMDLQLWLQHCEFISCVVLNSKVFV